MAKSPEVMQVAPAEAYSSLNLSSEDFAALARDWEALAEDWKRLELDFPQL